ncbi:MAG TPA: DNA polymerase III subunit gamma/tau, partial [Candidatus Saccharibacteria bacterium]|nr:DNA polymerase III subunit gamma/tau [Candidatus Saccharibacteria bacterium]
MSLALYRKYRSKSLDEIVGQSHITTILANAIASGRTSHAYLFTGPRGVGKTSVARILAHALNELDYNDSETHLDIIEIDAASNNGVEDVRDLRDKVQLAPVSAKKKVYIIDEVHMLSKPAFNALLKTLEEPPEHVVFILATTDLEKLPDTIVSRTQRYSFRNIAIKDAVEHLRDIAKKENIAIHDDALELIAERGDGSFRDSISVLDQIASLADGKNPITRELIEEALGLASNAIIQSIIDATAKGDIAAIATILKQAADDGINPITLAGQLTSVLRDLAIEQPAYLSVLSDLLDVAKSSQPQLKLLSVLGHGALQQQSKKPPKAAALRATPKSSEPKEVSIPMTVLEKNVANMTEFSWPKVVAHAKEHHVALFSLISKCGYEYANDELTLFVGNNFTKGRVDNPKYKNTLSKIFQELFGFQPTIHTVPTAAPLKDSQAASVAAIMGGGEEVS